MDTSDHEPAKLDLLSLPAELRLEIYSYLRVSSLMALDMCNKSLHCDVEFVLSQRAALKISRRKGESGKASYKHALQNMDRLLSTMHLQIQNIVLHSPYTPGRRMKTFPAALEAFDKVLIRLEEIGIKRLTIALNLPKTNGSDAEEYEAILDRIMSLLDPSQNSDGLVCRKLIVYCGRILRHHFAVWQRLTGRLEGFLCNESSRSSLEVLEVWMVEPSTIRTELTHWLTGYREGIWCQPLDIIRQLCDVRIARYDIPQDIAAQPSVCLFVFSRLASLIPYSRHSTTYPVLRYAICVRLNGLSCHDEDLQKSWACRMGFSMIKDDCGVWR